MRPRSDNAFHEEAQLTLREFDGLKRASAATLLVFIAIANDLDPNSWVDSPKLAEGTSFTESYVIPTFKRLLTKEGVIEWLEEEFEGDLDEDELEEVWEIGEFAKYTDARCLMEDIEFDILHRAINESWDRACKTR